MEIKNPCYQVLTNFEVLEALRNSKDTKKKVDLRNLATITYETKQYLDETPCKYQNRQSITEFIKEMKRFKLKMHECLMMVNNPPTSPLHIQLLIEDSEERLTDENVEEILNITKAFFPGPPNEVN